MGEDLEKVFHFTNQESNAISMNNENVPSENVLLTQKAYALSLSAPRVPPYGSKHYNILLSGCSSKFGGHKYQRKCSSYHDRIGSSTSTGRSDSNAHQRHFSVHYPPSVTVHDFYDDSDELVRQPTTDPPNQRDYDNKKKTTRRDRYKSKNLLYNRHPHLLAKPGDRFSRILFGRIVPPSVQHYGRDSGLFRSMADGLVQLLSAPILSVSYPSALRQFIWLSKQTHTIYYGPHKSQYVELYRPERTNSSVQSKSLSSTQQGLRQTHLPTQQPQKQQQSQQQKRWIVFMHGGAWGSGLPWFYRLVAMPFLRQGYYVMIVGYRTYPDGKIKEQVQDLQSALSLLSSPKLRSWLDADNDVQNGQNVDNAQTQGSSQVTTQVTLIGHSSGAHVALLFLVDQARKRHIQRLRNQQHPYRNQQLDDDTIDSFRTTFFPPTEAKNDKYMSLLLDDEFDHCNSTINIDSFVGLSGPYDISHHFDYEASRGVEELSPLKPVNGSSRSNFRIHSPAQRYKMMHPFVASTISGIATTNEGKRASRHHSTLNGTTLSSDTSDVVRTTETTAKTGTAENDTEPQLTPSHYYYSLPNLLFVHGIEDDTVPFTSTAEAVSVLRSCVIVDDDYEKNYQRCDAVYLGNGISHQDTIIQLMLGGIDGIDGGGETTTVVLDWIESISDSYSSSKISSASIPTKKNNEVIPISAASISSTATSTNHPHSTKIQVRSRL